MFKSNHIVEVGFATDDLEEMCLYHLHFTPTRCRTPSCIMFSAIAFNVFMKKQFTVAPDFPTIPPKCEYEGQQQWAKCFYRKKASWHVPSDSTWIQCRTWIDLGSKGALALCCRLIHLPVLPSVTEGKVSVSVLPWAPFQSSGKDRQNSG